MWYIYIYFSGFCGSTLRNWERMGSNIWCRWTINICTTAYVIRHSSQAFKFLQKRICHAKLWEYSLNSFKTMYQIHLNFLVNAVAMLTLFIETRKLIFSLRRHFKLGMHKLWIQKSTVTYFFFASVAFVLWGTGACEGVWLLFFTSSAVEARRRSTYSF